MRPAYESKQDLDNQKAVADHLSTYWGCQFVKTPRFYEFDYTIVQGKDVKAFAEVKVRGKQYDTLLLSLHKWQMGIQTSELTGKPFLLIAKTPQGLYHLTLTRKPMEITLGGRTDRGDDEDIEPCVLIPYTDMVKL